MSVLASCEGSPIYTWKKGASIVGTSSNIYAAPESGTYSVEVMGVCGTAVSSAVTVTVNPRPLASLLSDATTAVTTEHVTATAGDGVNYIWGNSGATLLSGGSSTDKTIKVKWLTSGEKELSVRYTVDDCPTDTAKATVIVSDAETPTIIAPALKVCSGDTHLYVTQPDKYDYLWTVIDGEILGDNNNDTVMVKCGEVGDGHIKVSYRDAATSELRESLLTDVIINGNPVLGNISAVVL
jgi:hypothetical protein